ncbi:cupredoxin domain-containing protein [Kribbella sp. DT2]|uniref:cupredoxin domain-containing protein n=1 Tax=Kribbella sp. DT2 TaxID=3393427 RepID=UPI003CFB0335
MPLTYARLPFRVAATALVVVVLNGCGGSADTGGGDATTPFAPATTPAAPSTATPGETEATPTPAPSRPETVATTPAADVTLDITVAKGKVSPSGKNVAVKAGQTVRVTATSDVADTIHVHGYDKELTMQPGKETSLTFVADNKGSFEIETHESGKLVAKLNVS